MVLLNTKKTNKESCSYFHLSQIRESPKSKSEIYDFNSVKLPKNKCLASS